MVDEPRKWMFSDLRTHLNLELNQSQRDDLKRCFDMFDICGSGKMNMRDLKVVFRALGYELKPKEMKRISEVIDVDSEGNISFQTFLRIIEGKLMDEDNMNDMTRSFMMLSRGEDAIAMEDLQEANRYLGIGLNDEEMVEMLELADQDDKGSVSFDEFREVMKRVTILKSKDPMDKQKEKEQAHGVRRKINKAPKPAKYKRGTIELVGNEPSSDEEEEEEEEEGEEEVTTTKALMGLFARPVAVAPAGGGLFGPAPKRKTEAAKADVKEKQPYKGIQKKKNTLNSPFP